MSELELKKKRTLNRISINRKRERTSEREKRKKKKKNTHCTGCILYTLTFIHVYHIILYVYVEKSTLSTDATSFWIWNESEMWMEQKETIAYTIYNEFVHSNTYTNQQFFFVKRCDATKREKIIYHFGNGLFNQ